MSATPPATHTAARGGKSRRISWDVIRVVGVLAVVAQHATFGREWKHPELGPAPFLFDFQVGASVLIVISVYFVCVSVRKGNQGHFMWNRLARLMPPFVVAAAGTYLVILLLAPHDWSHQPGLYDLVANVLLLPNWLPHAQYIDESYWTMPLQVTAFGAAAVLTLSGKVRGRWVPGLVWAAVIIPLVAHPFVERVWFANWVYIGVPLHRAHLLAIGVGIWLWSARRIGWCHAMLLLAVCLYAHYVHTGDVKSTQLFGVLLLAVCAAAKGPDWPVPRWLVRPVRWLAGISFGVYLVNQELGYLVMRAVRDLGFGASLQVTAMFAAAIGLGWLLTIGVERPTHGLLMRRSQRRETA